MATFINQSKNTSTFTNISKNTSSFSNYSKNTSSFGNLAKNFPTMTAYWKLDETTGDAVDYVNGYTLTNSNVTYSTGKINNGAVFNGSSASLVSTTNLNLFSPSNFSISAWFNRGATPSAARSILSQYSSSNVLSVNFRIGLGQVTLVRYDSSGTAIETLLDGGNYVNSQWHHAVVTFDSSSGTKIYVDGTLTKTGTNTTLGNIVPSITAIGFFPTSFSPGSIDEVGTWNTTLSQDDVTYLYNSTSGKQPPFDLVYSNFSNQSKNSSSWSNISKS